MILNKNGSSPSAVKYGAQELEWTSLSKCFLKLFLILLCPSKCPISVSLLASAKMNVLCKLRYQSEDWQEVEGSRSGGFRTGWTWQQNKTWLQPSPGERKAPLGPGGGQSRSAGSTL